MELSKLLLAPIVTEASTAATNLNNQYQFKVHTAANKQQIKHAIQQMFNVEVEDVKTLIVKPKQRRFGSKVGTRPSWKKAIVTLKKGQKIEFVKGV